MWQKTAEPLVQAGRLVVVGVVQEQHPDRARLYRQWRGLDWPVFVDSLNLLDIKVVPIAIAIDESGVVRHAAIRPRQLVKSFVDVDYPPSSLPASFNRAAAPDVRALLRAASERRDAVAWRRLGDACFLISQGLESAAGTNDGVDCDAVDAYRKAVGLEPRDGRAHFRLGVALRARYEGDRRQAGDGNLAGTHWLNALAIDPNQYIWRRRIQQFGPRLDKPYNFYFWVEQARREILARGERPVSLVAEPTGSEVAPPLRRTKPPPEVRRQNRHTASRDASEARITRDDAHRVELDTIVTPSRVRPGAGARVHLGFRVNPRTRPFWNNEADDLTVRVDVPSGVTMGEGVLTYPNPQQPETREDRSVEFELRVGRDVPAGPLELSAYALYYVCDARGGKCRYLRKDFTVSLTVDASAPRIGR